MNHFHAFQIRQEIDDVQAKADSLGNIGTTYRDLKDWKKALDAYYQSLSIRKKLGLKWEVANSYRGIGFTYLELAIDSFKKREDILKQTKDVREAKKLEILIHTINQAIDNYLFYRKMRNTIKSKSD